MKLLRYLLMGMLFPSIAFAVTPFKTVDGLDPTWTIGINGPTVASLLTTANGAVQIAGGNSSATIVTATGGSTARSLANRAADTFNALDYGATGNGTTDDAAAINTMMVAARAVTTATNPISIVFPAKSYVIRTSLNFSGLNYADISAYGAKFNCYTAAQACVDFSGSSHSAIRGLTVNGILTGGVQTTAPSMGLWAGRAVNANGVTGGGATLEDVFIRGSFAFSSFYMQKDENDSYNNMYIENRSTLANTWVVIEDGNNFWNPTSLYTTPTTASGTYQGMDEDAWWHPIWAQYGPGHTAWFAGAHALTIIGGYTLNPNTTVPPIVLWDDGNKGPPGNTDLEFGMHFEVDPTSIFTFAGPLATPTLPNFKYTERGNQATGSIFSLGTATSVTMPGLDIRIPIFYYPTTAKVFDTPTAYTGSGNIVVPSAVNWVSPPAWSGCVILGSSGSCLPLLGTGLSYANSLLSLSLPSPLNISSIATAGAISSITPLLYTGNYTVAKLGSTTPPPLNISAPNVAGGVQATAHVSSMNAIGITTMTTAGSGYTVSDILTAVGGTCTTPTQARVTAVTGGVPTAVGTYTRGICSVLPPEPVSFTGGTGTGYTASGIDWAIGTVAIDNPGSGYTAAVVTPTIATVNGVSSFTTTYNSNFTASGGNGQIQLNNTGTELGTSTASTDTLGPETHVGVENHTGVETHANILATLERVIGSTLSTQTAAYTFTSADCGTTVRDNMAAAHNDTVPLGLPLGCKINLLTLGAGLPTIVGATGVTVEAPNNSGVSPAQYTSMDILIDTAATVSVVPVGGTTGGSGGSSTVAAFTSGTANNVVIGGTTAAAGTFTSMTAPNAYITNLYGPGGTSPAINIAASGVMTMNHTLTSTVNIGAQSFVGTAASSFGQGITVGNWNAVNVPASSIGLGWNASAGQGEADIIVQGSVANGGFRVYQETTANTIAAATAILSLDKSGNLSVPGTVTANGVVLGASGSAAATYTSPTTLTGSQTLTSSMCGLTYQSTDTTGVPYTVPTGLTNCRISFVQGGTGPITFVGASGETVNAVGGNLATASQWSTVVLKTLNTANTAVLGSN